MSLETDIAMDDDRNVEIIEGIVCTINTALGDGYAEENPVVIAAMLNYVSVVALRQEFDNSFSKIGDIAEKLSWSAEALHDLQGPIGGIADAIRFNSGVSDALSEIANSIRPTTINMNQS
jgi:hypothetical protein